MKGFWANSQASESCAVVAPFALASSVMRSTKGLFAAMVSGWKRSKVDRRSDFGSKRGLCVQVLRQIAHAHWPPRHEPNPQLLARRKQPHRFQGRDSSRNTPSEAQRRAELRGLAGSCWDSLPRGRNASTLPASMSSFTAPAASSIGTFGSTRC